MRKSDMLGLAWDNLRKKKVRTFLTTSGVMIGVGALICMFAFGQGMQRNIQEQFNKLGLFNYIMVTAKESDVATADSQAGPKTITVLDDAALEVLTAIPGVEGAYPEMRFPVQIHIRDSKQFTLAQVLPSQALANGLVSICYGQACCPNEPNALIVNQRMLWDMDLKPGEDFLGESVEIRTLTLDLNPLHLIRSALSGQGMGLPIGHQSYPFHLTGISQDSGMGGGMPMRSDVIITHEAAQGMKKLAITSLFDFFNPSNNPNEYGSITVKVTSPDRIDAVKEALREHQLQTFAWIDQFQEMKTGFLIMDLFLIAVGMIGTTVACLGIVNTMVMSVLERTREIGIMKAVGASDRDIHGIFLVESALIGLLGGIMGLILARLVAGFINLIINAIAQQHGVPAMHYFAFPLWLCFAAMVLSVVVSLIAGFFPTCRAASVDPVAALRHD